MTSTADCHKRKTCVANGVVEDEASVAVELNPHAVGLVLTRAQPRHRERICERTEETERDGIHRARQYHMGTWFSKRFE